MVLLTILLYKAFLGCLITVCDSRETTSTGVNLLTHSFIHLFTIFNSCFLKLTIYGVIINS